MAAGAGRASEPADPLDFWGFFRVERTYTIPWAAASASRRAISLLVGLPGFLTTGLGGSNGEDRGASSAPGGAAIGEALEKEAGRGWIFAKGGG